MTTGNPLRNRAHQVDTGNRLIRDRRSHQGTRHTIRFGNGTGSLGSDPAKIAAAKAVERAAMPLQGAKHAVGRFSGHIAHFDGIAGDLGHDPNFLTPPTSITPEHPRCCKGDMRSFGAVLRSTAQNHRKSRTHAAMASHPIG